MLNKKIILESIPEPQVFEHVAPTFLNAETIAERKQKLLQSKVVALKPYPIKEALALAKETALLRKQVIAALDELKAKEVNEIDIRAKASFADLLFIASGTSTRHVKSIADEVVKFVKMAGMMPPAVIPSRGIAVRNSQLMAPMPRTTTMPTTARIGSTTNPVSRSSTTAAHASVVFPVSADDRLTRRTSPPIVDGRRFPTNWPAR